jgi:hypothetical protein
VNAPTAEVVQVRGQQITIRCPYCSGLHVHSVPELGTTEHRSPGCGMFRSADDRAAGYTFTVRRVTRRADTTQEETPR